MFAARARDVIHAGFFLVNNFVVLAIWWFVWTLHAKASWNFLEFLTMMGSPIGLYLAANLLVSDVPSEVASWREHFASVHRWYFAAILATVVFAIVRMVWVLGGEPGFTLGLVVLGFVVAIGTVSPRRSVHAGILIFWLVFQIFSVTQRFTTAG